MKPFIGLIVSLCLALSADAAPSTAGWVMPTGDALCFVVWEPARIAEFGKRNNLPQHTLGITLRDGKTAPLSFVPPLNTVEDMEIWRHEGRHQLEGPWH